MMRGIVLTMALGAFGSGAAAEMDKVGQCERAKISAIGSRLQGEPDSGTTIEYSNEIFGVSYRRVPQIIRSRIGDPVLVCLLSIPKGCPPGDDRGRVYGAINLRTNQSWELPDSSHGCGGA